MSWHTIKTCFDKGNFRFLGEKITDGQILLGFRLNKYCIYNFFSALTHPSIKPH
jgi:hypothetical protein